MQNTQSSIVSEIDYLADEASSAVRHEYVAGAVFAMAGGSKAHNTISGNVFAALRAGLRGRGCGVYIADMRVRIAAQATYYYPDVVVTCAASDLAADAPPEHLEAPCLIVEVLSRSTEAIDRREKLVAYRQLASLTEYLLVDQEKCRVELHRRVGDGWTVGVADARDDTLSLVDGTVSIPLVDVYEGSGVG